MRFTLIDRIIELQPGVSITAVKALTLAEEYLQDHFPRFPVMPGVLMLEAMFQAATWLVYLREDFRHSTVILKEARNIKYADFVRPGQTLTLRAELVGEDENLTRIKGQGWVGKSTAVTGTLVLERFKVGDRNPSLRAWDSHARAEMRRRFSLLYQPNSFADHDQRSGLDAPPAGV
jgi:3-hydroxyacyl-[acyl-carrier-protein] dehydratase